MASYTRAIESMRLSGGCDVDTASGTVMGGRDAAVCYANRAATRWVHFIYLCTGN